MTTPELEQFDANPEWHLLLGAYSKAQAASTTGWVSRIHEVEGVPHEQLSPIHGKLIALGFLKFEIAPQAQGIQYQLLPSGKQALMPPEKRQIVPDWMLTEESVAQAAAA
jgi:hypothetical protein